MLNFMREGGYAMWVTLAIAVGTIVTAYLRSPSARAQTLAAGATAVLASGLIGLSTGLIATTSHFARFPRALEALAEGIRESSANGVLAAPLAVGLLVGAAVSRARAAQLNDL